jgi:hypothetical protein
VRNAKLRAARYFALRGGGGGAAGRAARATKSAESASLESDSSRSAVVQAAVPAALRDVQV